jgi:hypothetical protein
MPLIAIISAGADYLATTTAAPIIAAANTSVAAPLIMAAPAATTTAAAADLLTPAAEGITQAAETAPSISAGDTPGLNGDPTGITQGASATPPAEPAPAPAAEPAPPAVQPNGGMTGPAPAPPPGPELAAPSDAYAYNPQLNQPPGSTGDAAPYDWNNINPSPAPDQAAQGIAQQVSSTPNDIMQAAGQAGVPTAQGGSDALQRGIKSAMDFAKNNQLITAMGVTAASRMMQPGVPGQKQYAKPNMSHFQASTPHAGVYTPVYAPTPYAVGGPVETMSAQNAVGANQMYPQAGIQTAMYSNPETQRPMAANVLSPESDVSVDPYTGEQKFAAGGDVDPDTDTTTARNNALMGVKTPDQIQADADRAHAVMAKEGFGIVSDSDVDTRNKSPMQAAMAQLQKTGKRVGVPVSNMPKSNVVDTNVFHAAKGGITENLGGYSDGGHLLKGPGDGMSDNIPASIGHKQPARLADGEFVIPADVVSHLGNGSTEAGAKQLYAMMANVRKARTGNKKQGKQIKADKYLPT